MLKHKLGLFLILVSLCSSEQVWASPLMCRTLPELFKAYLVNHVLVRSMSDDLKAKTAEQYINQLDGSKTLLLESDVATIRKELVVSFENLSGGNCTALDKAQALLFQRATESEQFVRGFLIDNYVLDENVEFLSDPKKRSYPKTTAERDGSLKKYIHFQIVNYLSADTKLPEAKKQLVHRYELITKRIKERTAEDGYNGFTDAFANALDPHSSFLSSDRLADFKIDMSLSLEGIGASLSSQDGYTVVEEIIPGGAADRAKILVPKDKIIAVAQGQDAFVPVIDMDLREVVKLIRGKSGTPVRLAILRAGEKTERIEVRIIRDKVDLKEQAARLHFEDRNVGGTKLKFAIIDLPSFYGDSDSKRSGYEDMKRLLKEAQGKKADGVVLNLSRNGGGLLEDAVRISGLFIRKGPIVATRNSRQMVDVLSDRDEGIEFSGPLVVLISRISASASEILAGALKDYKRAVILGGDHTFGKGTVQAVVPLPGDLGAMKVTTGMFFIPGGQSTQHQGVTADIPLPSIFSNDDIGEKYLDNSLPPQAIPSFVSSEANFSAAPQMWTPMDELTLKTIRDRSEERVKVSGDFAKINKDIAESNKNEGVIRLSEFRKKSNEDKSKKKSEEKKSMADRLKDADAPYTNEALNVLADLTVLQKSLPLPTLVLAKKDAKTAPTAASRPTNKAGTTAAGDSPN